MTETEIETPTALPAQEPEAKLPWESIDPDEPRYAGAFASSTAITAVEAGKGGHATSTAPILRSRFSGKDTSLSDPASTPEREEELAAHAFFSDEKITVEGMNSPSDSGAPIVAEQGWSEQGINVSGRSSAQTMPMSSSGSLAPVLGGEGWGEGPVVEDRNISQPLMPIESTAPTASVKADPAEANEFTPETEEAKLESRFSTNDPSPQPSPLSTGEREPETILAPEPEPLFAPEPEPLAIDETPWAAIDVSPAEPIDVPVEAAADESNSLADDVQDQTEQESDPAFVSRTLPSDAVAEAAVTFSTSDSLLAAASELATLAESFTAEEIEQPGDATILVPVYADEEEAYAVTSPQLATEPELVTATAVRIDAPAIIGGGWTLPLMCMGIGLIACCMVIPQGEANRRLRYEQATLAANLQHVQKQVAVNDGFLKKVMDDPTLAERLAGRQMKTIRKGQHMLSLNNVSEDTDMSAFALTKVPAPAALPAYRPKTGTIANLCNNDRSRLYLLGASLTMVAVGLVMGFGGVRKSEVRNSKPETN